MTMSSDDLVGGGGGDSPHDAKKVWFSVLHHDIRNLRLAGSLSMVIDLGWMIDLRPPVG